MITVRVEMFFEDNAIGIWESVLNIIFNLSYQKTETSIKKQNIQMLKFLIEKMTGINQGNLKSKTREPAIS